jgi:hypothetical protein
MLPPAQCTAQMLPDPAPDAEKITENPDDPEFVSELWHDLDWSPWVPFDASREFWYIPKEPGLYRIRPVGKDFLMYIGETGQSLHKKLAEFRQSLRRADLMPWSDPHDGAPCLWAHWVEWVKDLPPVVEPEEPLAEGEEPEPPPSVMFEFSAAPLDASTVGRKGMEAFLLYLYRQEHGESPLCNFGRFHPRYRMSSLKKENRRGGKLADGQQDNPAGFPSLPPLKPEGKPGERDWMGLEWTAPLPLNAENTGKVGSGAGLFLLMEATTGEVLYIGQSDDVAKRLMAESRKEREGYTLQFSYQILGQKVLPHNLRELECDLIGNFYELNKRAPELRFRNPKRPAEVEEAENREGSESAEGFVNPGEEKNP